MYQEKPKMSTKKKIEIAVGVAILVWVLFLMVDYFRYTNGKTPIFAIHTTKTYDDGTVDNYYGLFYTYRAYKRTSITEEEFVPFWKPRKNPAPVTDIPQTYSDYTIPDNPMKEEKFRGLLYFYGKTNSLLGTYKCINTDIDCTKAIEGYDEYDINYSNPFTRPQDRYTIMDPYSKFAFVDDSENQTTTYGQSSYRRTIYLLDYTENVIIARFGDVKALEYDKIYKKKSSEKNLYITKDYKTNKWGIIELSEDGTITQKMEYEYDSINYDEDTGYFITKKGDMWYVYDLTKDVNVTDGYSDIIYDVWINKNKTTYIAVGKPHTIGEYNYIDYKIYRADGQAFLTDDDIVGFYPRNNFMFYIKRSNNKMLFITYNKAVKAEYQLYFAETEHTKKHRPCVEITDDKEIYINFNIYKSSDPNAPYESYNEYFKDW